MKIAFLAAPILAVVVLLVAAGCHADKEAKEAKEKLAVVEKRRPEAQASLDAIAAIGKKELSLANGALTYSGEPLSERRFSGGNMAVMTVSCAANIASNPDVLSDDVFGSPFDVCNAAQEMVHPEAAFRSAAQIDEDFDGLAQIKYVLLIKPLKSRKPEIKDKEFVSGLYRGEAYLFDLNGKAYGGVAFQGANSASVEYTTRVNLKTNAVISSSADRSVDTDFCNNVRQACQAALAERAPASGGKPLISIDTHVF